MTQRPLFRQVTIIGLGLIGGSLGLALRRRRVALRVIGVARRAASVAQEGQHYLLVRRAAS